MRSLTALSFSRGFRVALVAAFIVMLVAPVAIFAQSNLVAPAKKAPKGKMTLSTKSLTFPKTQAGTSSELPVTLTNATAVAITITKITTSGAGFSPDNNCGGTLAATTGACQVMVTFSPTSAKGTKATKVTGTLTIKDNASNSPQTVKLSAVKFGPVASPTPTPASGSTPTPTPPPGSSPTPTPSATTPTPTPKSATLTPTPVASGTPFAVQAAGIYVFNTGPGVSPAQVLQYTTSLATGATSLSTMAASGTGMVRLEFTPDGKHAYGLDSSGNIWGYSVSSTGALTPAGSAPTAPPTGTAAPTFLQAPTSSILWVQSSTATSTIVQQYPIKSDGTLGSPTAVTLGVAEDILPFSPQGSTVPTGVWALSITATDTGMISETITVYPVNSDGTINSASIQTVTAPFDFFPFPDTTPTFAYGIEATSPSAQTLNTYSIATNGTFTANATVSLPAATSNWEPSTLFGLGVGGTINLYSALNVGSGSLLVYPISSSGGVGSILSNMPLAGSPEFPFSDTVAPSGAAAFSYLPTLWVFSGSTTIDEFTINSNGAIGGSSGSVATGSGVTGLYPEQSPFAYGLDTTSGTVYAYLVSSAGALTLGGSFVPTVPAGQNLEPTSFYPFPPVYYSSNPVALFVYASSASSGTIWVYPLGSNGTPSGSPLDTISTTGAVEAYVVFQNGELRGDLF